MLYIQTSLRSNSINRVHGVAQQGNTCSSDYRESIRSAADRQERGTGEPSSTAVADAVAQGFGECLQCPVLSGGSPGISAKPRLHALQAIILQCIILCCLKILISPTEASVGFRFKGWDRRFTTCKLVRFDGNAVEGKSEFEALVMVNSVNEVVSFEPAQAIPMCDVSNHNLAFVPCGDSAVRQDHTRFVFPLPVAGKSSSQHDEKGKNEGASEWRITKLARAAGGMAYRAASTGVAAGNAVVNYIMGRSALLTESLHQKLARYRREAISYGLECQDPVMELSMKSAMNPPIASVIGQGVGSVIELEGSGVVKVGS
ncbi:conserved hypothetical protein [Neospora caninum Liverpool]|uniref:Uncharacterized protein n=1 Tax=Neospora caninum (strain Liverpool) TaxID=572307 RepID=F0VFG8_NEOCL|nr:conserved hypothetical protein [Neospora caninum Liverpool]CBZ52462.1 conserved hypothetical protein [Neospora caninum Liverpool]CEL66437.1 TPA: hypothetical protein BN1204_022510 [Neospora caninum Liverpool]|eukprot:XP_003882494.1 conserved hypothetical protein [Neospora caninum Liverpool]